MGRDNASAIDAFVNENRSLDKILIVQRRGVPGIEAGHGSTRTMAVGTVRIQIGASSLAERAGWIMAFGKSRSVGDFFLRERVIEQACIAPGAKLICGEAILIPVVAIELTCFGAEH